MLGLSAKIPGGRVTRLLEWKDLNTSIARIGDST